MISLWKLWQATATRHARKTVVVDADTGRAWTGAELTAEAERLAATLRAPVVPISQPNGARWVATFLAIQNKRAIALPLDPSLPSAARRETVRRVAAQVRSNACCIKLTSGTTGELKAVPCTPAQLRADGEQVMNSMGIRPGDCNLAVIPLGHSYGLGNLVMPLLLQGTAVVCVPQFVPRQILQLIEKYEVTILPTVPAILRALAQLKDAAKPPSLRLVISAGAPLSADVAQQFHRRFGIRVHNFYGSSETGGICYDRTGHATLSGRSVGKPLCGVTVRLRRDGRVAVNSRAGSATLPDLGRWNRYGELQLLGRVGEVANIGGRKVAPAEIERQLQALPGVTEAWLTVLKDQRGNDCLAAAVESERSRSEIEQELARSLAPWKLPRVWLIEAALPRSDRGKLHTSELKARLSASLP